MTKPLFEHTECNRCAGTGRYASYGTCFKCSGARYLLTKRGWAAQNFLNASRRVNAADLKAGDVILFEGFTAGSYSVKSVWKTVDSVEQITGHEAGYRGGSIEAEMVTRITAGDHTAVGLPTTTYRLRREADVEKALVQAALDYQSTLTKAGKPAKATKSKKGEAA